MEFEPKNRNYTEFTFGGNKISDIDPVSLKLVVGDSLTNEKIKFSSKYRKLQSIPGILIYANKTYGKRGSKFLYKCIPNDPCLPEFLIPFVAKNQSFSKDKENKYILFKFLEWKDKHPLGNVTQTIGDVSSTVAFNEYQMHCKEVNVSLRNFTNTLKNNLKEFNEENISSYHEDRTGLNVFTIDPSGSQDFDDAMGFQKINDNKIISIYISDVPYWIEKLALWDSFTERVATIYLPDKKYPMLPSKLSDEICSLRVGEKKYTLTMDVIVDFDGNFKTSFSYSLVSISNNYVYDETALLNNVSYQNILLLATELNIKANYLSEISNSHDVVAYFMIMMNCEVAKLLYNSEIGIFRSVMNDKLQPQEEKKVPCELKEFICIWKHTKGTYHCCHEQQGHSLIGNGVHSYLHITSPIRRIVDLLNIMILQNELVETKLSNNANRFKENWLSKISFINQKMKSIQQVQRDCVLLKQCIEYPDSTLTGYIIEKNKNTSEQQYKYSVYIPQLKMVSKFYDTEIYELYRDFQFMLFVFMDEATLTKKVRLQLAKQ